MNDTVGDQSPGDPGAEPTEEELRAALDEQMRNITVQDVLMQTVVTLVNLAARRLGLTEQQGEAAPGRDLEQSRVAIEAVRALLPLCRQEGMEQVQQALSQLQIAYAKAAQAAGGGAGVPTPGGGPAAEPAAPPPPDRTDEGEREKPRSKLWTPPGS